jgi:hypothetical protein
MCAFVECGGGNGIIEFIFMSFIELFFLAVGQLWSMAMKSIGYRNDSGEIQLSIRMTHICVYWIVHFAPFV